MFYYLANHLIYSKGLKVARKDFVITRKKIITKDLVIMRKNT